MGPPARSTSLPTGRIEIMGKPVISSTHCPAWTGTSGSAQYLAVGAMSTYVVAQRMGLYA